MGAFLRIRGPHENLRVRRAWADYDSLGSAALWSASRESAGYTWEAHKTHKGCYLYIG